LLGVFSNTIQGIQGGILLGLGHGFVSSGLFICAGGILYDRSHTRLITIYRGLVQVMPLFSILFFILCLSNAGTPLSLNFIGEFLSLYGIFERLPFLGIFASSSIVLSAAYTMYMFNRIVFGGKYSKYLSFNLVDLSKREYLILIVLVLLTVLLGIYPSIILDGLHYNVSELMYNSNIDYSIDMCTAPLVVICYKTYKYEEKYDFNYLYLSIETVLYSGLFISSMLPGLIPENIDGLVYVPEIIPKCINPILNQLHAMNIDIHDLIIGGAAVCNVFPFFRLINFSNHTQQHVIDLSSQSPMAIKEFLEIPAGYVWDSTRSHYIREVEFSNTERTVEITVKPGIICTPDPANPDNIHFKLTSQSMHIHFPRGAIVTGTPEYRTILATI
jgi:NADH-ubiquinone oxidoreductase chain 4